MRQRPSLARRILYAAIFLAAGSAILLTIAHIMNPPARCEERGGIWVIDGRYCDEAERE